MSSLEVDREAIGCCPSLNEILSHAISLPDIQ